MNATLEKTVIFWSKPVKLEQVLVINVIDTWTTAFEPVTSRTWPARWLPSGSSRLTISANFGNLTLSKITRGPFTPDTVR